MWSLYSQPGQRECSHRMCLRRTIRREAMLRPTIYIPSRLTKTLTALVTSQQEPLQRVAALLVNLELSTQDKNSPRRAVQLPQAPLDKSSLRLLPHQAQRSFVG